MVPEIWSATDRIFCHYGPFFALYPPLPPMDPENQNFEQMKKALEDIILQIFTINDSHMIYIVFQIWSASDKFFCHFRPFFALLPP